MGTEDVPREIRITTATTHVSLASVPLLQGSEHPFWIPSLWKGNLGGGGGHQEFSLGPGQGQPTARNKIRGPRRAPSPIPAAIPP